MPATFSTWMGTYLTTPCVVHLQFIPCIWYVAFYRILCINPLLFPYAAFMSFNVNKSHFVFVVKQHRVCLVLRYTTISIDHVLLAYILVLQLFVYLHFHRTHWIDLLGMSLMPCHSCYSLAPVTSTPYTF